MRAIYYVDYGNDSTYLRSPYEYANKRKAMSMASSAIGTAIPRDSSAWSCVKVRDGDGDATEIASWRCTERGRVYRVALP